MIKFVGLHAHSSFSIADGLGYPKDHYEYAQKNGMDALATTDHGNANAFGYMVQEAAKYKKEGNPFKIIYGMEAYLHPDLDEWAKLKAAKDDKDEEITSFIENEVESKGKFYDPLKRRHHLVLVVLNYEGMENLFRLCTESARYGFYKFPRLDFKMLRKYNKGLMASTACIAGLPSWEIFRDKDRSRQKTIEDLETVLTPLMEIFGKERFFLELQYNKLEEQRVVNDHLIGLSLKTGFDLISTVDSHYSDPELWRQREIYRVLGWQKAGWKADLNEIPKTIDELKCELYPKNGDQLFEEYKKMYSDVSNEKLDNIIKQSIERTHDIAWNNIEYIEPDPSYKLPKYKGSYRTEFEELKNICLQSMKEKGFDGNSIYVDRLISELKIIKDKDFASYFITLYRCMDKIKKELIVGPARGSAGGSLVCYLMGITQLDPIYHDLLFERFLSEYREDAPDIDTDVEDRDIAREVLGREFGEENVIAVSNFNTYKLKSLIKDLSRLYDIPFDEVNNVTRVMEEEARQPLLDEVDGDQKFYEFSFDGALRHSPTFREFMKKYPEIEQGVRTIYMQPITIGRHAGGVIICEDAMSCMPIIKSKKVEQTPWTEGMAAKHLEQWGLIKYDFLGLATLRLIRKCIELILEEHQGIEDPTGEDVAKFYDEHLHPDIVKEGDPNVFEKTYKAGKFPGVFQFSQGGVQNFCVKAQPESVEEISAITSLWRPGPLCLSADTQIYTSVGRWGNAKRSIKRISIKDLYSKYEKSNLKTSFRIASMNENTGEIFQNKIKDVFISGLKDVYSISYKLNLTGQNRHNISSCGSVKPKTIKASSDHKFLTNSGWKALSDLTKEDYILILSQGEGRTDARKHLRKPGSVFGRKNFKNICFRNYKYNCLFCDWKEGSLDVNHIDGNRAEDNSLENLSFLCPNHHRMYTEGSIKKEEIIAERKKFKLPETGNEFRWAKIQEINLIGKEETYDIEVESPHNNFIAGGIVVHNSAQADKGYIQNKKNKDNLQFEHPILEKILKPTHKYILYQEQFMQLAHELGGFSLTEADKLRKLLVRPVTSMAEEMKQKRIEEREKFIEGCVSNGLPRKRAEVLWDDEILGFISYGFNKAHSTAYAYVSYQTAWLLTYYEKEWICAYLEKDNDLEKAISDATSIGYKMAKPSVLKSKKSWTIEDKTIYPSLPGIKGIGDAAVAELLKIRSENEFKDFYDFLWTTTEKKFKNGKTRIKRHWRWSKFNKRAFDALIKLEAFDDFDLVGPDKFFKNYKHLYDVVIENYDKTKRGTVKLEEFAAEEYEDWSREDKIDFQKELLNTYDKNLLFPQRVLDLFEEHDILPLGDISEATKWHWFILKNVEKKKYKAKNGHYYRLKISDVFEKDKILNYFGKVPEEGFKRHSIYIGMLHMNGQWMNVSKGQALIKA